MTKPKNPKAKEEDLSLSELNTLYRKRLKDRKAFYSRRRRQGINLPEAAENILEKFFRKDPEATRKIEESRALEVWEQLVGSAAAAASQPIKVRGHRLIVRVPDPMWRQQLLLLKGKILRHYRQKFPRLNLKEIFFVSR